MCPTACAEQAACVLPDAVLRAVPPPEAAAQTFLWKRVCVYQHRRRDHPTFPPAPIPRRRARSHAHHHAPTVAPYRLLLPTIHPPHATCSRRPERGSAFRATKMPRSGHPERQRRRAPHTASTSPIPRFVRPRKIPHRDRGFSRSRTLVRSSYACSARPSIDHRHASGNFKQPKEEKRNPARIN